MSRTVLVVDDSAAIRQAVAMTLKSGGYDVIEACDGKDALGKLLAAKVSLVLCDVNMPVMDGISFVRLMKATPTHRFTPVVMLTTETSEARKEEGRRAGAKAWMVKPVKPGHILEVVSKMCLPA